MGVSSMQIQELMIVHEIRQRYATYIWASPRILCRGLPDYCYFELPRRMAASVRSTTSEMREEVSTAPVDWS